MTRTMLRAGIVLGIALAAARAGGEDDPGRPLVAAAARGDSAAVRALLRDGTDPDRGDPASGWTALHEAARSGSVSVARALLVAGATPDLRARSGGTALDVAETAGQAELARVLRAAGARGSGKSIGDTVCVRLWAGEGFCAAVLARDQTRFELRVERSVGCARGCPADALCSGGKTVASGGLGPGDRVWVEASCLTHTGVK